MLLTDQARSRRWPAAVTVLVLLVCLSLYAVASETQQSAGPGGQGAALPTVSVKVLTAFTAEQSPSFPGRVEAGDSAMLAFRVSGELRELKVRMGQQVSQGELLAELDSTDYRLNLEARQAEFDLAKLESQRATALFAQQLISEDQFDTVQTMLASNLARLEQAREQLSFCRLTAPFAGAIAFTYAMPSEIVTPQQPVLNLQDTSTLDIRFNLPLRFQQLLAGDDRPRFTVMFELMPGVHLEADYKELGMQPDPDTNSYPVTLLVDSPEDFSARPGMPVTVSLHHASLAGSRWLLPAEAVFERDSGVGHVWRIDTSTMTIHKVAITLGDDGRLLEGLSPGDQIVAAGVDRLREGQSVRPWLRQGGM